MEHWIEEPEPPYETPDERLMKVIHGEEIPFVLRREYIEELLDRIHHYLVSPDNYAASAPQNLLWEANGYLKRLVEKLTPRDTTST